MTIRSKPPHNRIRKEVKNITRSFSKILSERFYRITGSRQLQQGFIQTDTKEGVFADPSSLSTRTLLSSKRFIF